MGISFQVEGLPKGADPRVVIVQLADGSWAIYDFSTGGLVEIAKPGKGFSIFSQGSTLGIKVDRDTDEEKMMYWLGIIKTQPEVIIERIPAALLRILPAGLVFPVHIVALNLQELSLFDFNEIQEDRLPISQKWGLGEEFEEALMVGGEDFVESPAAKRVAEFAREVRQVWLEALKKAKQ